MQFIKDYSDLLVPRVFTNEVDQNNPVGAIFILMKLLFGTVAIDALGGYKVHRDRIPKEHQPNFYRSITKAYV